MRLSPLRAHRVCRAGGLAIDSRMGSAGAFPGHRQVVAAFHTMPHHVAGGWRPPCHHSTTRSRGHAGALHRILCGPAAFFAEGNPLRTNAPVRANPLSTARKVRAEDAGGRRRHETSRREQVWDSLTTTTSKRWRGRWPNEVLARRRGRCSCGTLEGKTAVLSCSISVFQATSTYPN